MIILAFGLFIAEAFVASHGILGAGGVISFVTGSLLLSAVAPRFRCQHWTDRDHSNIFTALMALLVVAIIRGKSGQLQQELKSSSERRQCASGPTA